MRWTVSCTALLVFLRAASDDGAALAQYSTPTATTPHDSVGIKSEQVECPVGTALIGGGAWIGGDITYQRALISSSTLYDLDTGDPIGWAARAMEVETDANGWNLTVRAICGHARALERATEETASNSNDTKALIVECPAGKSPISGGFALHGTLFGPVVTTSAPAVDVDTREAYGWAVSAREAEPTDSNWSVSGEVICADADVTLIRAVSGPSLVLLERDLVLVCPAGTLPMGGGAQVLGSAEWISASYFESSIAWRVGVTRLASDPTPTRLEGYALCPEPVATLAFGAALGALALARRRSRTRPA
jgi:hypothetical protein